MTQKRSRRIAATALVGATLLAGTMSPASADDVTVSVDNPGGSRTVYIEDVAGSALTTLDFGTGSQMPFRVRVVDTTFDRAGFSVAAEMSNLYLTDGSVDFDTSVDSSNLAFALPTEALNILDVSAVVAPVFDVTSVIADPVLCTVLGLVVSGGECSVTSNNLAGKVQSLNLPIDLANLVNLPLLPQSAEIGSFDAPVFAGVAAADPAGVGAASATARRVIDGTPIELAAVTDGLDTALATALGALALSDKIDTASLTVELRDALGPVWDTLNSTQTDAILAGVTATADGLLPANVQSQTGTYLSYPVLELELPEGTEAGTYTGTLVVTAISL